MQAGNVIFVTNLLRSRLDFSQIFITEDLIFFPNRGIIIYLTERETMKATDEYKVCSLEEAEAFARKREKMSPKNYPPHIVDEGASYQQKVEEAPYHPGYEDAVITSRSNPVYKGMEPDKMLWKPKPLSDEEIIKEWSKFYPDVFHTHLIDFVRAIEERHGIK